MQTVRISPWAPVALLGLVLFSVFLTLGYGIIGLCAVVLLGAVVGGAVMSWIAPD
ncbi:MAG: hypothetical protein JWM27_1133 [Gemmatimonadetes bacterium]|jgi:hypothetical protein|nr:hypothetical protein [Gemmatimonadota bacterium]